MPIIKPAATVLVVKEDTSSGIQVLLLKRNAKLSFAPDFWVFPGGRIDAKDGSLLDSDLNQTAKLAAVREAFEEANIVLDPDKLSHFCHWTTPAGGTRRFSTWFFHTRLKDNYNEVVIDESEIVEHQWIHPRQALQALSDQRLNLLPPTFITLNRIKHAQSYADVQVEFARTGVVKAAPVTITKDECFYCLYEGDAGYDTADIKKNTSKHRLIIDQRVGSFSFEYERCDDFPPVTGGIIF